MRTEIIPERHEWWRIAGYDWTNPLDPSLARDRGGRWNPPDSFPTLYLNEDHVTARRNLRLFIDGWPYEPEDLRDDTGPVLVGAVLPRRQLVADVHTPAGIQAIGLPASYPFDTTGAPLCHHRCQQVGVTVKAQGLRGVRCRSAQSPLGAGRELAWFPANSRSRAHPRETLSFTRWFWA